MTKICTTLPYPPTVNRYWRYWNGKVLISREGRDYSEAVGRVKLMEKSSQATNFVDSSVRLRAFLEVRCPDKRERDLDNVQKAIFDAMQKAGYFLNDSQFDELLVIRGEIKKPGEIYVEIAEIPFKERLKNKWEFYLKKLKELFFKEIKDIEE
jgi:crossover junction endodeoxyribonuclease RusA